MIKSTNADLPRDAGGNPPSEAKYLPAIIGAWLDAREAERDEARGEGSGSVIWASDAGRCSRQLHYDIRVRRGEIDVTNPFTIADRWRFATGQMAHDAIEAGLALAFPGSEAEVKGEFGEGGTFRMDALIKTADGRVVCAEWKSVGGYQFKRMATSGKSPAEGPRLSAFLQGAICAYSANADELVVGIVSLENMSPAEAKRAGVDEFGRWGAEWHYTPDEFRPAAEAEIARLNAVLEATDLGLEVPRTSPILPLGADITDPKTGGWQLRTGDGLYIVDSGSTWQCGYCSHAERCQADREAGQ